MSEKKLSGKTEIFPNKKQCGHGYKYLKRVNDIEINGNIYRQVSCEKCGGKYKYKIDPDLYHPMLMEDVIHID